MTLCLLCPSDLIRQCTVVRSRLRDMGSELESLGVAHLRSLLERVVRLLEQRLRQPCGPRELRVIAGELAVIAAHLAAFDTSELQRAPWAVSVSLARQMREHPEVQGSILLVPQPAWEFAPPSSDLCAYFRALFADVLPDVALDAHFRDLPPALLLFGFPQMERENVLLHAALGQGVGHLLARQFLTQHGQSHMRALREQLYAAGVRTATTLARPLAKLAQAWQEIVSTLLADAVCVRLYGPPALLVLARTAERQGMHPTQGENTPPWTLRLFCAMEQLRRVLCPWDGTLAQALADIARTAQDFDAMRSQLPPPLHPVYDQVARAWPEVGPFLDHMGIRGTWMENPDDQYAFAQILARRLRNRIPPNADETNPRQPRYANDTDIVMACWLAYLDLLHTGNDTAAEFELLCRLGMKALEDIQLVGKAGLGR